MRRNVLQKLITYAGNFILVYKLYVLFAYTIYKYIKQPTSWPTQLKYQCEKIPVSTPERIQ